MTFGRRVKNRLKQFASNFGFYSGANLSPSRIAVYGSMGDFHVDTKSMDCAQLRNTSRWIAVNSPYYAQILNLRQLLTVGPRGLPVIPNSGDPKFDETMRVAWDQFCMDGDLGSDLPFEHSQAIASMAMDRDGETFAILCWENEQPKIQWIEAHRVRSFGLGSENNVADGVVLNQYGRPIAYQVSAMFKNNNYRRFAAENVIHFYDPERFGQRRGIPICTSVINDFIDLIMLQSFVMDQEKYRSSRLAVVELPGGEKINFQELRAKALGGANPSALAQRIATITDDQKTSIKESLGATVEFVPQGTKVSDIKSDTPSPNTLSFFDHLVNKVFIGCDLTRQFVHPVNMQGTQQRIVLEVCNEAMVAKWAVLAHGFARIYKHVASAKKHETRSPDWWKCSVLPPRAITADLGYEMEIIEKGLRYGLFTYEDILARRGKDPKEHFDQLLQEYEDVAALAKSKGVAIPELVSRGLASLAGNISPRATEKNEDEEELEDAK